MCGQYFVVCSQNARQIVDETEKVKVLLQGGEPVIISVAPSFVENYEGVGIEAMDSNEESCARFSPTAGGKNTEQRC